MVALATAALAQVEQAPGVPSALSAAGAGLGLDPDTFLAAFNKSVPTACGLLGEKAAAAWLSSLPGVGPLPCLTQDGATPI